MKKLLMLTACAVAVIAGMPSAAAAQDNTTTAAAPSSSDVVVFRRVIAPANRNGGTTGTGGTGTGGTGTGGTGTGGTGDGGTGTGDTGTDTRDASSIYAYFPTCGGDDGTTPTLYCVTFQNGGVSGLSPDTTDCSFAQSSDKDAQIPALNAPYVQNGITFLPPGATPPPKDCSPSTGPFAYGYSCSQGYFQCEVVDESHKNSTTTVDQSKCDAPQTDTNGDQAVIDAGLKPVGSGVDQSYACDAVQQTYARQDKCVFHGVNNGTNNPYYELSLQSRCWDLTSTPVAIADMFYCTNARPANAADVALAQSVGMVPPATPVTLNCSNPTDAKIVRTDSETTSLNATDIRIDYTFQCQNADNTPADVSLCAAQIQDWDDADRANAAQIGYDYTSTIDTAAGTRSETLTKKP